MILLVIAVVIVAFLVYVGSKPSTFIVQRQAAIAAPPERIYPLIADFRQWAGWSPYEGRDPDMARTYSGAATGKGAVYEWSGDNKVGAGRMEILEANPSSEVVLDLHMLKPMQARNTVNFSITPSGAATTVVWVMSGRAGFMHKAMGVFMNMDKLVGRDFEVGLSNLRTKAEAA